MVHPSQNGAPTRPGNTEAPSRAARARRPRRSNAMLRLALGFVIGYVLGAKAGQERYEQIRRVTSTVSDSPAVQGVAGFVEVKVTVLRPGKKHEVRRPDAAYLVDDSEPR